MVKKMTSMILSNVIPLKQPQTIFMRRSLLPHRWDYFWQIESGVVRTFTWLDNGTVVVFGLWGKGDVISPLLSKADPFKMECLTKVKVAPLLINQAPEINQALIAQTHQLQELMAIKQCRPIHEALIKLLIWLGNKFGGDMKGGKLIDLHLTHQEIAEILGTTRVTVTRNLNIFEKQGIIERLKQGIIIYESVWCYSI